MQITTGAPGNAIAVNEPTSSDPTIGIRTLTLLAFSATAGVMIEFYDFYVYGYAAASAFPAIFFPNLPPTRALVFSYLAFGAGFPPRLGVLRCYSRR
jgi:hypothetical protein